MNDLPGIVERIYRLILHAYPPEYLDTFGEEMQNTFIEGLQEAGTEGTQVSFLLRELRDAPRALANSYWYGWSKKIAGGIELLQQATSAADLPPAPPDGRESWRQFLLEISMFLIAGLLMILATYGSVEGLPPGWQRNAEFLGKIILPLTVPFLLVGLAFGLPRWTYPLGGLLLGYSVWIAGQTSLWLFLALMLLAACLLFAAAILTDPQPSRLPVPVRRIGQSLSQAWTRLSFGIFGAMPLVILMVFDDAHTNSRTPFFALSVVAMIVSALVYCRSRDTEAQIAALLAGLTFSIGGAWLDAASFHGDLANWTMVHSSGLGSLLWMGILWVQWAIFILSPLLFILFKKVVRFKLAV